MAEVQQEVSGSVDTLAHLIDDGQIEKPNLMAFNAWQQWRSRAGRRPTVQRDGVRMTQRNEANLWRQTMAANYGDDWQIELEAGNVDDDVAAGDEDDEDAVSEADPLVLVSVPGIRCIVPAYGARHGPSTMLLVS